MKFFYLNLFVMILTGSLPFLSLFFFFGGGGGGRRERGAGLKKSTDSRTTRPIRN